MTLSELFNPWVANVTAALAVLGVLGKVGMALFEFNDEYLRKRRLKYYTYLESEAKEHPALVETIKSARREELTRSLFGKVLEPGVASALMAAYQSKCFLLEDLRASSSYAKLNSAGELEVNPGVLGRLVQIGVISYFIVLWAYALVLTYPLLVRKTFGNGIAALVVFVVFSVASVLFVPNAKTVAKAFKVRKELAALREKNPTLCSGEAPAAATELKS
jgi:hypothetical protein